MEGVWAALLRALSSTGYPNLHDRRGDKLLLPPSALESIAELTLQKHGTERLPNPLVLKLSYGQTSRYAGVLEFTAPEGHVVVPDWLLGALGCKLTSQGTIEGLNGAAATSPLLLRVASADLPRASMITLRPYLTRFHLSDDPQALLQLGLHGVYTTLRRGETIRIADLTATAQVGSDGAIDLTADDEEDAGGGGGGGASDDDAELLVGELWTGEPRVECEAVLIVDIEALVVDLGESCEGERERLALEEQQRRQDAALEEAMREGQKRQKRAEEEAAAEAEAAAAAEVAAAAAFSARQMELRAALIAEPAAAGVGVSSVMLRLPGGGSLSRRFECTAPLQQVRDWVESHLPVEECAASHGRFELVSSYPRFVSHADNGAVTLETAGLGIAQAALHFKRVLETEATSMQIG